MSSLIESKHRGLEWDLMSWCGGWGVTMADRSDPEAVLITGVYGSGKTSVVEEIADVLERRGVPYAALDLDCPSRPPRQSSSSRISPARWRPSYGSDAG